MENKEIILIFLLYIVPMVLFIRSAFKMHIENDSEDPFKGSHIVVLLIIIGLVPIINIILGVLFKAMELVEWDNKRRKNKLWN